MIEEYDEEKTTVKLTKLEASQILNGRILEGHRVRIGVVEE